MLLLLVLLPLDVLLLALPLRRAASSSGPTSCA
jgi:hypothetical protein